MIQQFRFTLILLGLNALAFLVLFFASNSQFKAFNNSSSLTAQITEFTNKIDALQIKGENITTPLLLVRTNNQWTLEEPTQWPANSFAVEQIIHALNTLEASVVFSLDEIKQTDQSLSDYGLDEPLLSLNLYKDTETLDINIGKSTALGNKLYLYLPRTKNIYVVGNSSFQDAMFELNALRKNQIFDLPKYEIDALNIQMRPNGSESQGTLSVRIEKNPDGSSWSFESPLKVEADPTLVSKTIEDLTHYTVEKFIQPDTLDSELLGFNNPSMKITLQGNKRRRTLILGNPIINQNEITAFYAKLENNPSIFTVDASIFNNLIKAQRALREKNFIQIESDSITTIEIASTSLKMTLQKLENDEWQALAFNQSSPTKTIKADKELIEQLIGRLQILRASDFFADAPTQDELNALNFNAPLMEISAFSNDQESLKLSVVDNPEDSSLLLAKIKEDPTLYTIEKASFLANFQTSPLFFKNKIIEKLPKAAQITQIQLTDLETQINILDQNVSESDLSLEPLLSELQEIKVKEYIDQDFAANNPNKADNPEISVPSQWRYKLTYKISFPGDSVSKLVERTFYFGSRLSGTTQIGGSAEKNLVFTCTQPFIEALFTYTEVLPNSATVNQMLAPDDPKPIEAMPELEPNDLGVQLPKD